MYSVEARQGWNYYVFNLKDIENVNMILIKMIYSRGENSRGYTLFERLGAPPTHEYFDHNATSVIINNSDLEIQDDEPSLGYHVIGIYNPTEVNAT